MQDILRFHVNKASKNRLRQITRLTSKYSRTICSVLVQWAHIVIQVHAIDLPLFHFLTYMPYLRLSNAFNGSG
jgi:hypothetical protein